MPSGIFALFGKSNAKVTDTKTAAATAADSVDFLRRNSASTLIAEPTDVETKPSKPTDPYKLFVHTVETDLLSMQKQQSMRQMRWKVPSDVSASQALKGAKRTAAPNTTFDVEKVGSLSYVVARW
ncbi:hypothetical protein HDU86_005081 [Geranomyces michiganensis]|nr:hypothetical protein HDU86_005081 [Geranomyces michiganensis]